MATIGKLSDYIDPNLYYYPDKILSQKDIDGLTPSQFCVDTNRGDGKTTSFLIDSLLRFYNNNYETVYLFRDKKECEMPPYMFEDVFRTYPELRGNFRREKIADGIVQRFHLNGKPFVMGVSLKDMDSIKRISGVFGNATRAIMEEFQTETGKYLPDEVGKVQSVFTSMNRGGGKRDRNMKLIMLGNHISLLNPYYVYRGIHKRWRQDQKYYRGKGWVVEISYNPEAAHEIGDSAMNRSFTDEFGNNRYGDMATGDNYLFEANAFIEKPLGRNRYICTLVHGGIEYGVREYYQEGVVFIGHSVDPYCQAKVTFSAGDHKANTLMLNHYSFFFKFLKQSFQGGYLYFEDDKAKIAIFDILGLTVYV